jgi:hypothetical protein
MGHGCIETWLDRKMEKQNIETLNAISNLIKEVEFFAKAELLQVRVRSAAEYDAKIAGIALLLSRYEDRKWASGVWDGLCEAIIAPVTSEISSEKVNDVFGVGGKYNHFCEKDKIIYLLNKCSIDGFRPYKFPMYMYEKYLDKKIKILINNDEAFKKLVELIGGVPKEYINLACGLSGYMSKNTLDIWWGGVGMMLGEDKVGLLRVLDLLRKSEVYGLEKISLGDLKNTWVDNKRLEIEFLDATKPEKKRKTI